MKSATVDAIRKLEAIIEVYDAVPDGWFSVAEYRNVTGTSTTATNRKLTDAVKDGRAERKQIRLAGHRPIWIYRAKTQSHTTEARRAAARPRR